MNYTEEGRIALQDSSVMKVVMALKTFHALRVDDLGEVLETALHHQFANLDKNLSVLATPSASPQMAQAFKSAAAFTNSLIGALVNQFTESYGGKFTVYAQEKITPHLEAAQQELRQLATSSFAGRIGTAGDRAVAGGVTR